MFLVLVVGAVVTLLYWQNVFNINKNEPKSPTVNFTRKQFIVKVTITLKKVEK